MAPLFDFESGFCFKHFFALPEKLAFVALPLSEYSLTYSGPPTAHRFHAWEAQLPAGLSTLFAGPNQTTAVARQTLAVLKASGQGRGGQRSGEGYS